MDEERHEQWFIQCQQHVIFDPKRFWDCIHSTEYTLIWCTMYNWICVRHPLIPLQRKIGFCLIRMPKWLDSQQTRTTSSFVRHASTGEREREKLREQPPCFRPFFVCVCLRCVFAETKMRTNFQHLPSISGDDIERKHSRLLLQC